MFQQPPADRMMRPAPVSDGGRAPRLCCLDCKAAGLPCTGDAAWAATHARAGHTSFAVVDADRGPGSAPGHLTR